MSRRIASSCDGARAKRYESRYVAGVYVAGLLEAHQRKLMGREQEEVVARTGDTLANDNAIRETRRCVTLKDRRAVEAESTKEQRVYTQCV